MVRQRNRRIHFQSGLFGSFDTPWSERSWIDLFRKETQNPFSDSFGFKNSILYFLKEAHPYIRCSVWVRKNFASLCIVDGGGAIVAASQVKAVELDLQWRLISTSNCLSSCFLQAPVGDPFYERCNPFNTEWNWHDPDRKESPENFVAVFYM